MLHNRLRPRSPQVQARLDGIIVRLGFDRALVLPETMFGRPRLQAIDHVFMLT